MKKITFLLFALTVHFADAQNYSTIIPGKTHYFERTFPLASGKIYVEAMQIDSVSSAGSTSIFHPFRSFTGDVNFSTSCLEYNDTSWMGPKIIARSGGNEVFYNVTSDSIVIQCSAPLNQTWHLFELGSGNYIEGKVSAVFQQTVLGSPDSVKIISMQAKNSGGANVAHDFNNKYFLLSKNNGLTQCYRFQQFPNDTNAYVLKGTNVGAIGTQNLTAREIFDFNAGDIFEYHYYLNNPPSGYTNNYKRKRILSKSISANNDTLSYSVELLECNKAYTYSPPDSLITTSLDTLTETIVVSKCRILNGFAVQMKADTSGIYNYGSAGIMKNQWTDPLEFNGRMQKKIFPNYNHFNYPACVTEYIGWCIYHDHFFAEGLGLVGKYDGTGGMNNCGETTLTYYEKGIEIYGTPQDWSTLLQTSEMSTERNELAVFPNPAKNSINFSFTKNTEGKLEIFNSLGEKVAVKRVIGNSFSLDLSENFAPGIYFYRFISVEGKSVTGKFIKE